MYVIHLYILMLTELAIERMEVNKGNTIRLPQTVEEIINVLEYLRVLTLTARISDHLH